LEIITKEKAGNQAGRFEKIDDKTSQNEILLFLINREI